MPCTRPSDYANIPILAETGMTHGQAASLWSRFPGVCSIFGQNSKNHLAPFFLISGLNVLQSLPDAQRVAEGIAAAADSTGIPAVFKASFDKANRTSLESYRGPGIDKGLRMLETVKRTSGLPVLTDVHETWQAPLAADVVDVLQIPAMLCRQTSLIQAVAETGKVVNVKKGQFASPAVAKAAVSKATAFCPGSLSRRVILCERGSSFGYNQLVVDFTSFEDLREENVPLVLDATHAAQRPPSGDEVASRGKIDNVLAIARAGVAVGIDGLFLETHIDPSIAPCDGGLQLPLHRIEKVLSELVRIAACRAST